MSKTYTDADWRSFARAFNRKTNAQRLAERLVNPDFLLTRSQQITKRLRKSREVSRCRCDSPLQGGMCPRCRTILDPRR